MRITIVSYYGLLEASECAAKALRRLGHEVEGYGLRIPNYSAIDLNNKIEKDQIVLFWTLNLGYEELQFLKQLNPRKIFCFFNWDDPHYWGVGSNDIQRKSKCLDVAFTCCQESVEWYKQHGTKQALFCPPGFDPTIHYFQQDPNYECDISICCTNLYDGEPNQIVPRRQLVDLLVGCTSIRFHIYGPQHFQQQYPNHYKGWIPYDKTHLVYANSKINICTHVIGTKRKYINERAMLITGSRGLLYIDDINGLDELFIAGTECVVIDKDHPVEQIQQLLHEVERRESIVQAGYVKAMSCYTYDNWAKIVDSQFTKQ